MYDPVSGSTASCGEWACEEGPDSAKDVDAERGEGEPCALRMLEPESSRDAPPSGSTVPAFSVGC